MSVLWQGLPTLPPGRPKVSGLNDNLYAFDATPSTEAGPETFVSLGGKNKTIIGGFGTDAPDSFWYDSGTQVYGVDQTE